VVCLAVQRGLRRGSPASARRAIWWGANRRPAAAAIVAAAEDALRPFGIRLDRAPLESEMLPAMIARAQGPAAALPGRGRYRG